MRKIFWFCSYCEYYNSDFENLTIVAAKKVVIPVHQLFSQFTSIINIVMLYVNGMMN